MLEEGMKEWMRMRIIMLFLRPFAICLYLWDYKPSHPVLTPECVVWRIMGRAFLML